MFGPFVHYFTNINSLSVEKHKRKEVQHLLIFHQTLKSKDPLHTLFAYRQDFGQLSMLSGDSCMEKAQEVENIRLFGKRKLL